MFRPTSVNILGVEYKISYLDKPSDVDIHKREACWGQIDYWTRTIRVYRGERTEEDIFRTILHEVLHGLIEDLNLDKFSSKDSQTHREMDTLATGLADALIRNDWIKLGDTDE